MAGGTPANPAAQFGRQTKGRVFRPAFWLRRWGFVTRSV
jgi:hypothetical protein